MVTTKDGYIMTGGGACETCGMAKCFEIIAELQHGNCRIKKTEDSGKFIE
jgi:hypothetical protein